MNKYFSYPNIELWNGDLWTGRISKTYPLVKWIGELSTPVPSVFPREKDTPVSECKSLPYYFPKTNSVDLPDIVASWKERGVHYECRSQGGVGWILMAPTKCMDDFSQKIPSLIVMLNNDIKDDPYWAMSTLAVYQSYNDMVAEQQDIAVIYISAPGPDTARIYLNILQEAYVFIPGDMKHVYLDVSKVYECGKQLKDCPEFKYWGSDPDADTVKIGAKAQIPSLDVSGNWENRTSLSRDQMMGDNWSSASYSRDKLIHSVSGQEIAEGLRWEYDYETTYDEKLIKQMADMGLKYENREKNYRRWKMVTPFSAFDEPEKKLPVLCVLQEVNSSNDHLAVKEISYFYEYFRIAAQGECLLVNFVLEDNDSNDLLADIIEDVLKEYPADPSRVYVAGHSHNGFYALEFAIRHPKLVAAVATFGDPAGFMTVGNLPMTGARLDALKAADMPIINLIGLTEHSCHFPLHSDASDYRPGYSPVGSMPSTFEQRAASWQLRLEACSCPMKTADEIAATKNSPNYAIRKLGIPADKAETYWMDGNEIYIADIKNNAGKYHLRIVGEENMPHNTTPNQQKISWSWLRRFARNTETGESIDLY